MHDDTISLLKAVLPARTNFSLLEQELREEECSIYWIGDRPQRQVQVAVIEVRHPDGRILVESQQQSKVSGEIRHRNIKAVSEKFKPGETPTDAALRGLREELGLEGDINLTYQRTGIEHKESGSYPLLETKYTLFFFSTTLSPDQVREDYIADEGDKFIFFDWLTP